MLREVYEECVRLAAASSRSAQHARDLAHAVLLDAIERGAIELEAAERPAWLRGALRRHAAFEARTAARRRSREARWQSALEQGAADRSPWRFSPELLARLSPALRALAALAAADLDPREIRSVLRLTDTAFRKRLSELRRAVQKAEAAGIAIACKPPAAYALGAARAELLASLRPHPSWAIASHDPDGHPLIFSRLEAHERAPLGNCEQ